MIKTLKSELNLRPTYDEMIGMIEDADKENRPPIEKIIDRRATIFRNNQFGSQFDNIDFLGLKKQEEDRAKEATRQAQLRQAGIMAGTSSMSGFTSSGFSTPAEVYEAMDASSEASRGIRDDDDEMTSEEAIRIRAEMERYLQRQQQAQEDIASSVSSDLDDAHRQSLPAGVEFHRMYSGGTDASRGFRDDLPPSITDIPANVRQEQPSSSSSGIGGAIASGAKAVGGAVLEAGKEAVKTAVASGVQSAITSLI